MVNISANITRKYTSIVTEREQLAKPIHLHQHIKTTILLTSSYNHTHNITFLILLLKKKGRASQKMATLKSVTVYQFDLFNLKCNYITCQCFDAVYTDTNKKNPINKVQLKNILSFRRVISLICQECLISLNSVLGLTKQMQTY